MVNSSNTKGKLVKQVNNIKIYEVLVSDQTYNVHGKIVPVTPYKLYRAVAPDGTVVYSNSYLDIVVERCKGKTQYLKSKK